MSDSISRYEEIRNILTQVSGQSCENIGVEDDLFEAGILDSFGIIEFVLALEKQFHCTIAQEDLIPQNLWSIQAVSETLSKLGV
jgi:acyl carrier protein